MKLTLLALSLLLTAAAFSPTPVEAAVVIVTSGPGYYSRGTTGVPVVTGTIATHIGTRVIGGADLGTTVNRFSAPNASCLQLVHIVRECT